MLVLNSKKFKFIDYTDQKQTSIFCAVCSFLLKTAEDDYFSKIYDCCHDCYLRYVESQKDEWVNGWRPSSDVVLKSLEEKSRLFIQ